MPIELTNETFSKNLEGKTVIVDFWAGWCGPCRMLAPVIEELEKEMTDLVFAKVDTDSYPDLAAGHGVRSLPTMIVFKDGKEVDRIIGYQTKDALKGRLQDMLQL